ncbi:MAG TPA: hypothetical protein VIG79_19485 [Lapillicoccus sp.]|jgi:hypothetical protein|uniref:hypothetical protein n=1 Tax=Lapillicoccus sp. TaxID=1909287 RepID=UPI002F93E77D
MRWERLFDDLEAQLSSDVTRELVAEVADRTRRERALVGMHERFAAAADRTVVEIRVAGVGLLRGLVTGSGPDWVLLDHRVEAALSVVAATGSGTARVDRPMLVPTHAIRSVTGLGGAEQTGAVAKAFGLGSALRAVSRDRAVVDVVDVDGAVVTGTIDSVGQDYLEVAEHSADLPRRAENVLAVRAIPFAGVAMVRRR